MAFIPTAAHQFGDLFRGDDSRVLRVSFSDGAVFRLRGFSVIDPSIYGDADKWMASVEEAIAGHHPDFRRLFPVGSSLDFVESDITEILDEGTGDTLFTRASGTSIT
jgi:hypothetical protein